jgi:hypothetical protein
MKKDNGDIEATPTPFCVERNPGGKWGALFIGPDRGSYQNQPNSRFDWAKQGQFVCDSITGLVLSQT